MNEQTKINVSSEIFDACLSHREGLPISSEAHNGVRLRTRDLGMGCLSLGSRRILPQERDHEEHPADRQASPAEDRDQGEAVPLRHLPQAEPAAGEDACTVVLPAVRGGEGGAVSEY